MSDRLSPILVKELRQGMRARVFEGSFVLLQVLMLFSVIMAVVAVSARNSNVSADFGEGMFWTMLAIPVLLIMPMRGCTALKSEIDCRGLELIFLTRLTAWRIVFGKWAALFSQTCLLVVAILPYAVLRYYLGSVDLLGDLVIIGGMLGSSALLTAFTVSTSGFSSKLARSMVFLFPLVVVVFGPSLVIGMTMTVRRSSGVFTFIQWQAYAAFLFYGLAGLYYLLEIGASRIAPAAENHAVRKRLIAILLLVSGPVGLAIGGDSEFLWLPLALATPICVDALARQWNPIPGNLLPLLRWKRLGRGLAGIFLPGWPSGFLFTLCVVVLYGLIMGAAGELSDSQRGGLIFVSLAGTLFMPLAIIRLFMPNYRNIGVAYFVIQLAVFIYSLLTLLFNELFNLHREELLAIFPLSTLMMAIADEAGNGWLLPSGVVLAFSVAIILVRSTPQWRELRDIRAQADQLHRTPSATPTPPATHVG